MSCHCTSLPDAAAPRVAISLLPLRPVEGTTVTVRCEVTAEAEADVYFTGPVLNTTNLRYSISDRSYGYDLYYIAEHNLTITDLMTSDAGNYTCRANNTHGSATSEPIFLDVLGKYIPHTRLRYKHSLRKTLVKLSNATFSKKLI